jgi:hypothetical protein
VTWERIYQHNRNIMHNDLKGQAPSEALQDWMMEQMAWLRYVLCGLQSTLDEKDVRWPMGRCTKNVCALQRESQHGARIQERTKGMQTCSFLHCGSFLITNKTVNS